MIPVSRQEKKSLPTLSGKTQINLFFENSTRTQASFEIAGKRLGALVVNMSVKTSSVAKGETLIDTAATLNAMQPDVIVIRHSAAGAVELLSQKVGCSVINAGDGAHEHPTQALLDALTIRQHKGRLDGLTVAICGDIANSRVARSNLMLLDALNVRTRVIAPRTLLPVGIENICAEVFTDMREGLKDADVVMMLRLQHERASGRMIPSVREYFRFYGLDAEKLALRQARRHRHASRPDEPGRRDRPGHRRRAAIGDHRTGRDGRGGAHGGARRPARPKARRCGHERPLVIENARILDPASGARRSTGRCLCDDGRILDVVEGAAPGAPANVDARRCRRADPGARASSTCASSPASRASNTAKRCKSASEAAAAGGVTSFVMMPDANPVDRRCGAGRFRLAARAATPPRSTCCPRRR